MQLNQPEKSSRRGSLLALGLLALTAAPVTHAVDYPTTVVGQNPAAYWRFNTTAPTQPSVTTAPNLGSLGAADNGTYAGNQGFFRSAPGAIAGDSGVFLDGGTQAIQTGSFDSALNPAGNFTVETWAAPDVVPGTTTCVVSCGDFGSPRAGWLIYQTGTGFNLRMYNQNGLNTSLSITANTNMVAGTYYHLVSTFDGTTAKMYVNGVLLATGNPTGYVPGTAGVFSIGTRSDNAFYWAGKEDEVAWYPSVLSADTIAAHYSAATTNAAGYATQILASNPALYFRLGEAGDPLIANQGVLGAAAKGDIVYPATTGFAGPQSPSLPGFEANNYAMDLSGGGFMQVRPLNLKTNGVTITCWIQPNGSQAGGAGIVMQRARTAAGGAYSSTAGLVADAAGGLNLGYNWDGDASTYNWFSGVALNDGAWNFVALIIQSNQAVLFSPNGAATGPSTNYATHASLQFEGTTYIGEDPFNNASPATRAFLGALDEVAVFQRTLSLGEVYTEYGAALGNVAPMVFNSPQAPANPLNAGDPLSLVVDAGGTPGFTYQWRKNNQAIAGATTSAFNLPAAATTDSGNYDVVLNSTYGTVTSSPAAITVNPAVAPSFTLDIITTNRTLFAGGTLNLAVAAAGGKVTYQWLKGGVPLAGKTGSSLSIASFAAANAGTYTVIASNSVGVVTSTPAVIALAAPSANSYAAIVAADGPASWYRLDEPAGFPLMLDSYGRADGFYTNLSGSITLGAPGALSGDADTSAHFDRANESWGQVYPPPVTTGDFTLEAWVRTTDTTTTALCPVSSFRTQYGELFQRNGSGSWAVLDGYGQLDGSNKYRGHTVGPEVSGQWAHLILTYSSAVGSKTYINGIWDGGGPFVDFSRNLNTPFLIGAAGPYAGGLQLFMDGEVDEVAVYNKALSDAQILKHYQTGLFGNSTAPFFVQQPATQAVLPGTAVSFTAVAQGSPTITYQWFKNGVAVAGATSTTLSVASVGYSTNADTYVLRAGNPVGTNFSAPATVRAFPANPAFINATNGMVLHLKFDGDYSDSSGHGNSATAVGSPVITNGIIGSGALTYNTDTSLGLYNYLALGTPTDLNFSSNVDFSVSLWVQLPAGELSGDLPFLSSAVQSLNNPGFNFSPSYKLGGWAYSLNPSIAPNGANNSINNGQWHHLLYSFARTGLGVTYLDGVAVDTRSILNAGDLDTGNAISIGQDPTGTYGETGVATIDDMVVWHRALTAYEAYAIHYVGVASGKSVDSYGPVSISQTVVNGQIQFIYNGGTLQSATSLNGPWTAVPGATAPYFAAPIGSGTLFYRVKL